MIFQMEGSIWRDVGWVDTRREEEVITAGIQRGILAGLDHPMEGQGTRTEGDLIMARRAQGASKEEGQEYHTEDQDSEVGVLIQGTRGPTKHLEGEATLRLIITRKKSHQPL
jgi:hypothetical protein